ncbi:unnamed protein product, partial [Brenthis ino]
MPAARGVKRTASKSSAATASTGPKNKKKRGAIQLEIPSAPKKRGCVLTCGQGDVGQLGLGEGVLETTKFKPVSSLGNKIVDARAGGMHTIALDSDGKVWTFGCNDEGALGRPTAGDADEGAPRAVALPRAAVAVAAGDSHSAALLDNGDVYAWGAFRDSHGSMGLVVRGREGKACREPVRVGVGEPAVAVASGGDHLVILTTSGSVYTMGCGEQGQLGRLSQRSASRDARQGFSALLVPSKVTLKAGASQIWAGYHATFALDAASEKMFAWGLNNYGQLGITGEKRKTALFAPMECDAFAGNTWRAVAAGQHHSLALDRAGVAHALGRCEYGRLGLGEKSGDAEVLEPIPKLQNKKCVCIAAGTSNSFAVTDTGEVYAWGMGSEGQLGTGARADAAEPQRLSPAALRASAGGQHSVLLQEDPTAQKEASPAPEKETEEEKIEPVEEKRPSKRQKKQEQDEEISSTSSAQTADVTEVKPEKINGNEKKEPETQTETETPMEVDENDKSQENKDDKKIEEPMDQTDSEKSQDTSSQDTDVETKADVELAETAETAQPAESETAQSAQAAQTAQTVTETEVNGTVETKPVVLTTA